jgi:hypothetical protein
MMNKENQFAGVHEEFVKVLQGVSTLYRFGSDRVENAHDYLVKHVEAMQTFSSPELHPDTCQMYRNAAHTRLGKVDKDSVGTVGMLQENGI